jgi:hypothetical protein
MAVTWGFSYNSELSCGDLVLARESAEDLFSVDPVLGEVDLPRAAMCLSRCELVEGEVRPGGVVVRQVLAQYLTQMVLADDQHAVEKLAAKGTDHPLADGICLGRLRRAGEHPDARGHEHGVEGIGELTCRSLIRNLTDAARWPRSIRKFRAACVVHAPSGCAVMPARWTRRVSCSMTISA